MRSRLRVFMGCFALVPAAYAADAPVDPGLLEFLGSVDTEDKNWHEYLAHTDIDQVAKRSPAARAGSVAPPPSSQPVAASPPPKDPTASSPAQNNPPVNPK